MNIGNAELNSQRAASWIHYLFWIVYNLLLSFTVGSGDKIRTSTWYRKLGRLPGKSFIVASLLAQSPSPVFQSVLVNSTEDTILAQLPDERIDSTIFCHGPLECGLPECKGINFGCSAVFHHHTLLSLNWHEMNIGNAELNSQRAASWIHYLFWIVYNLLYSVTVGSGDKIRTSPGYLKLGWLPGKRFIVASLLAQSPLPRLRRVLVNNAENTIHALLPEERVHGLELCHRVLKFDSLSSTLLTLPTFTKTNTYSMFPSQSQRRTHTHIHTHTRHNTHKIPPLFPFRILLTRPPLSRSIKLLVYWALSY